MLIAGINGSATPGTPHHLRRDSFIIGSGDEARMMYLRNLLLKYLATEETVARQHMERAMGAVFQVIISQQPYNTIIKAAWQTKGPEMTSS